MSLRLLPLAVACLTLFVAACGSDESESLPDATVAYLELSSGTIGRIVRVAADGSHRKVLWEGGTNVYDMVASPDGRSILFAYEQSWYLLPADGGPPTVMAVPSDGPSGPTNPAWSPDGSAIAWGIAPAPEKRYLVIAAPGGTDATPLTPDSLFFSWAAWGSDSQQLVVCGLTYAGGARLYLMDRDGGNFHAIPNQPEFVGCGQNWAPSEQVAFASGGGIGVISPDGTGFRNFGPRDGAEVGGFVYWSDDERYISATDVRGGMWALEVATGRMTQYSHRAQIGNPWSPTGQLLAFPMDSSKLIDGQWHTTAVVGVARAGGGARKVITGDSVSSNFPVWLNDPSLP